jgi:hypothetical protein
VDVKHIKSCVWPRVDWNSIYFHAAHFSRIDVAAAAAACPDGQRARRHHPHLPPNQAKWITVGSNPIYFKRRRWTTATHLAPGSFAQEAARVVRMEAQGDK